MHSLLIYPRQTDVELSVRHDGESHPAYAQAVRQDNTVFATFPIYGQHVGEPFRRVLQLDAPGTWTFELRSAQSHTLLRTDTIVVKSKVTEQELQQLSNATGVTVDELALTAIQHGGLAASVTAEGLVLSSPGTPSSSSSTIASWLPVALVVVVAIIIALGVTR